MVSEVELLLSCVVFNVEKGGAVVGSLVEELSMMFGEICGGSPSTVTSS